MLRITASGGQMLDRSNWRNAVSLSTIRTPGRFSIIVFISIHRHFLKTETEPCNRPPSVLMVKGAVVLSLESSAEEQTVATPVILSFAKSPAQIAPNIPFAR